MARASVNHTFNFWNLRSVIDDCRRDFLKVYSEGKGREEAMGRVKDLQTILDQLETASSTLNSPSRPSDITSIWNALYDRLAEYPDSLRSDHEDKLLYLLLDSVYRVMASGDNGCNRLKWKAGSLEDVVCAGSSWIRACLMKLASSEEGSASYSEEASSQREDLRKKKLQVIKVRWYSLFKVVLDAQLSSVETSASRRIAFTVAECLSDSVTFSEENARAIINGQCTISNSDLGLWIHRGKSILLMKALVGMLVTLNASVTDPGAWIQQVFQAKLWGKQVAQSFWDILSRRLSDPEQGQLKLLNVLIHARNQQFRAFPIKTIHSGNSQQQLGLIDRLLIDGQSLNWQILDKNLKGGIVKDSALTDCYFANGKPIRMQDDGLLTIALNQDDTANFLEKDVTMRIQLDLDGGITDIATLLQTRGARVNPPIKHSLAKSPANVSATEMTKPGTLSETIAARTTSAESRRIQPPRADSETSPRRAKTTIPTSHQVAAAAEDGHEASEKPRQAKSKTVASHLAQADHRDNAQTPDSDPEQFQRSLSVSVSTRSHPPSYSRNHPSRKIVPAESTDLLPSMSGRTPRTYGKSKGAKNPRNKRSNVDGRPGEVGDASEGVSLHGNKRKIITEEDAQNAPHPKKARIEEEESGKGKAAAKAATKRDKSQSAPSQSAANFLHIPRMSTRNRPAEYARTASQSNAVQADTHEVASATLPDAHTHLIGDSYEKGGVEVSESQKSLRSQGFTQSKENPKKQTPKVQEDLFYASLPDESNEPATSMLANEPDSNAKSEAYSSNVRALRFSSPLEGSHKKERTDHKQMRSSLKKKLASGEKGGDAPALEVVTNAVKVQQAPAVNVDPPSTVGNAPSPLQQFRTRSTQGRTLRNPEEVQTNAAAERIRRASAGPIAAKEPGALESRISDKPGSNDHRIDASAHNHQAAIDQALAMDLLDVAKRTGGAAERQRRDGGQDPAMRDHMKASIGPVQYIQQQQRLENQGKGSASRNSRDLSSFVPSGKRKSMASPGTARSRKRPTRSHAPAEEADSEAGSARTESKSGSEPVTRQPVRTILPKQRDAVVALPQKDNEDLSDEELGMRKLIMKVYRVTWKATKEQMQTPIKERTATQERLAGLVAAVLKEIFADTQKIIQMWKENQERCYATISNKVFPALQRLEEESDRASDRARRVGEIWDARRLRIPEQILAWIRD